MRAWIVAIGVFVVCTIQAPFLGVVVGPKWVALAALVFAASAGLKFRPDRLDWAVVCTAGLAFASLAYTPDMMQGFDDAWRAMLLASAFIAFRRIDFPPDTLATSVLLAAMAVGLSSQIWPEWAGGFGNENWRTHFLLYAAAILIFERWYLSAVALIAIAIIGPSKAWAISALLGAVFWPLAINSRWAYVAAIVSASITSQ